MYSVDPTQLLHLPVAEWLRMEFHARREKNPSYSLRAFAKHLGITPGRLSNFLSGKRPLTQKAGQKAAEKLSYSPIHTKIFLEKIATEKGQKIAASGPLQWEAHELQAELFELVANWHHFAIRNLIKTKDFKSDVRWIGGRLGISPIEVRSAIDRLKRVGLVKDGENGLEMCMDNIKTSQDIPSAALRRLHKQHMELAIVALEDVAIEQRDITGITMAIDKKRLPEAKQRIKDFRLSMSEFLEAGERKEVYHLGVQLFPLTR
jgi:uncharacterized protein (TIGR02147 family)